MTKYDISLHDSVPAKGSSNKIHHSSKIIQQPLKYVSLQSLRRTAICYNSPDFEYEYAENGIYWNVLCVVRGGATNVIVINQTILKICRLSTKLGTICDVSHSCHFVMLNWVTNSTIFQCFIHCSTDRLVLMLGKCRTRISLGKKLKIHKRLQCKNLCNRLCETVV